MTLRAKTRQRLVILLSAVVLCGAGAGGGYAYLKHRRAVRVAEVRAKGMAAFAAGDYATALENLGGYLYRFPTDVEVLERCAEARLKVEDPNGGHLVAAIRSYQRLLDLKGGDLAVQRKLMGLYVQTGMHAEALLATDAVLGRLPAEVGKMIEPVRKERMSDEELEGVLEKVKGWAGKQKESPEGELLADAVRARGETLYQLRRYGEAIRWSRIHNLLKPDDIEHHYMTLQAMLEAGAPGEQIAAYGAALAKARPNDARAELIYGIALLMSGDTKEAERWVRKAAAHPAADFQFLDYVVGEFDGLGLYPEAARFLESAAREQGNPEVLTRWASRLLQANRFDEAAKVLAKVDPRAPGSDVDLLVLRALAILQGARKELPAAATQTAETRPASPEAAAILEALDRRGKEERYAAAWATVLRAAFVDPHVEVREFVQAANWALVINARGTPVNPFLHLLLGEAYARAGEMDLAIRQWDAAAKQASAWAQPCVRLSKAMLGKGRYTDALLCARTAERRAPDNREVRLAVAAAWALAPFGQEKDASQDVKDLMAFLGKLRAEYPEEQDLISVETVALARSGQRNAATTVLEDAIRKQPALRERVLLELASISHNAGLKLEQALLDASEKAHGVTADLAYLRGLWLYETHKIKALAYLEGARAKQPAGDLRWRIIWARFLDMTRDPRAKAEWQALAEQNPKDTNLQWLVLSSPAVRSDRTLSAAALERVRVQLDASGPVYQFFQARWLLDGVPSEATLAGQSPADRARAAKDLAEARDLLGEVCRAVPDHVEARLLLANVLERAGNLEGAREQLRALAVLPFQDAGARNEIFLRLASVLHQLNDPGQAHDFVKRVAASAANPAQAYQAALLLKEEGDFDGALEALVTRNVDAEKKPFPTLLLASLYQRANEPAKAEDICRKLVSVEKPEAGSIQFYADLMASQGRIKEAREMLARLDGITAAAGVRERCRGEFLTIYGTPQEAEEAFRAATRVAAGDSASWQELLTFYFRAGQIQQALAAVQDAARAVPQHAGFAALNSTSKAIAVLGADPAVRPLLASLAQSNKPAECEALAEALRVLETARVTKAPPRPTVAKLREIADRNPRLFPLHMLLIHYHAGMGQIDDAITLATRAMETFPNAVEPAQLATGALGAAGRWEEALGTAREWRRRAGVQARDADVGIAGCQLQLGHAAEAVSLLQPYVKTMGDPNRNLSLIATYAQALIAAGQDPAAEALLVPLFRKSPEWRNVGFALVLQGIADPRLAGVWMDRLAGTMPETALDEHVRMAQGYMALGKRSGMDQFTQTGRERLAALMRRPDASAEVFLNAGVAFQLEGDLANAETAYRRALDLNGKMVVALNNLADVIASRGGDLAEAQGLVDKALAAAPEQAAYYDTRATIQAKRKDFAGALASMAQALQREPASVEWQLNFVRVLLQSGQKAKARTEFQKTVVPLVANSPKLSEALKKRYDALGAELQ